MNIKDRMILFLDYLQIGQKAFEKKVGISNGYVNNIGKSIGSGILNKITNVYPELNTNWLLTGTGEMLNNEESKEIGYSKKHQLRVNKTELVPYYDIDVTSHVTTSFDDVRESPAFFVDYKPFNDCTAYVNNYGDSMYPKYKNGEKLAVKQIKNIDVIMWGETYLVITNGNANDLKAVKDVHPHDDKSKVILRSSNPAYKGDTIIEKKDIISMFAIKGKISQNFL